MPRLMFYIQHRLAQLRWSRGDLGKAGGPAPATLYKALHDGRELTERTLARLEVALNWQPGSAAKVIGGGRPLVASSDLVNDMISRLDEAVEQDEAAAVSMTAAELRDFLMTVAQQLDTVYAGQQRSSREVADVAP